MGGTNANDELLIVKDYLSFSGVRDYAGLQVVTTDSQWNPFNVLQHMHVTPYPGALLHVRMQIPQKQHADSERTACCSASRGTE